jgi:hypothetical protein
MTELRIGDQLIRFDREATVAAYSDVPQGWADQCSCSGCRNFARQRKTAYPTEFRDLLNTVGIDPAKKVNLFTTGLVGNSTSMVGGSISWVNCWKRAKAL